MNDTLRSSHTTIMVRQTYCIAGHVLQLEGAELVNVVTHLDGFEPFAIRTAHTFSEPALTVTSELKPLAIVPQFKEKLYSFVSDEEKPVTSTFGTTDGGYLLRMESAASEGLSLWCARGASLFYVKGDLTGGVMSQRNLRFAIWIAYGIATAHLNTIAIHSSTITYKGRNVLFLGESGTGKSTHTRLWREHIAGAALLNDDSPIVRAIDGEIHVYGSPWSGKTPCYKNERHPLAGCVRLSQAPRNRIRKLSKLESYAAIHPSCPPDFAYDEYLYDGISATLSAILSKVPFYHLECLPDVEAAELSKQTIFGQ